MDRSRRSARVRSRSSHGAHVAFSSGARLVVRRCAADGGDDANAVQPQAVARGDRGRPAGEAGAVQGGEEPVAGPVAGEHPAGAVRAVCGRGETDDEDPRPGHRTSRPVGPSRAGRRTRPAGRSWRRPRATARAAGTPGTPRPARRPPDGGRRRRQPAHPGWGPGDGRARIRRVAGPAGPRRDRRGEAGAGHGVDVHGPDPMRAGTRRSVTRVMRLGYQIPNFTYPGVGSGRLFDVVAAQAKEAEASGFDTVLVMDHFYQLADARGAGQRDDRVLHAAVRPEPAHRARAPVGARHRQHLPQPRDPRQDRDGARRRLRRAGPARASAPAGSSSSTRRSGCEFGSFTDRFERLEEALQIVLAMLRGEKPSLDGKWYHVKDAMNSPAPVGRIPVMIGGGGEKKTLRMVAQYADESNIICAPDGDPPQVRGARRALRAARPRPQRDHGDLPDERGHRPDARAGRRGVRGGRRRASPSSGCAAARSSGPRTRSARPTSGSSRPGVDGFTVNLPANGHVEGRVSLLGETLTKVLAG